MEVIDTLSVLCENFGLSLHISILEVIIDFLALNTHNAHEVISRVGKFGASELVSQGSKVVDSQTSFIKVDDVPLSYEHQAIENLIDIGVWLMDRADNSTATKGKLSQGLND